MCVCVFRVSTFAEPSGAVNFPRLLSFLPSDSTTQRSCVSAGPTRRAMRDDGEKTTTIRYDTIRTVPYGTVLVSFDAYQQSATKEVSYIWD
jgi:hypothetical protein